MRFFNRFVIICGLGVVNILMLAQTRESTANAIIQGTVQSASTPLPGVAVTATNLATNEKTITTTDLNGRYQLKVAPSGTYSVEGSMAAFASATKQVEINETASAIRVDFDLVLTSRSQQANAQNRPTVGFRGRGTQRLNVQQTAPETPQQNGEQELAIQAATELQAPGFAADAATESVAVLGNTAETTFGNNFNFDRQQIEQFIDQQFGPPGGLEGRGGRGTGEGGDTAQAGGFGGFPGAGGRGGGGRGGGGRGGGRGFAFGRGGRGFGATTPRGNLSYTLSDSALDAAPYSLTGQPVTNPAYTQNRFSATVGGPLVIPKIVKSERTNYTFTYTGTRNHNPYDVFSTVPSLAERNGDFSQSTVRNGFNAGQPVQIFDPVTHTPIPNNVLPQSMLDPAALGLMKFIPEPNLPGSVQNLHYLTSTANDSNDFNVRLNHSFANPQQQGAPGGRGGGGRGGGGFGGPFGGRGGGRGVRANNINFGLQVRSASNVLNNPFPTVSGSNSQSGLNATFGYIRSFGRLANTLNVNYNRNHIEALNLYAFRVDIATNLGITGVSQNPFDWGLPNLSFTNFSGLNDVRSSMRRDQTLQFSDGMLWNRGRHNLRWGGDFRRQQTNTHSSQNSRGTFIFTGASTAEVINGTAVQGTGYDLADFLLGLPQQTSLQYGNLTYNFRGGSWDVYFQDDWRIRGNVTLNLGLRYDYASPYTERDNKIVNLDVSPGFTAAVPVLPGQLGPYSGTYPSSLVNPDRNNVAPRVGVAWRLDSRTVVRAGYGITYNGAAYAAIASQMANQPPFSLTQTNIDSPFLPLTLQSGFPATTNTVTNNYGINLNYRIGYAQQWNLDVQRDLRKLGLILNLDYTGTKGTRLDVIEAPNRTSTGVRIADVQPFNWETSDANSILHSGSLRLRRRLGRGISVGGTYQFSKSIDNASSISGGGGGGTVAQDAFNLMAERGLSSFDQTHRLNVDYNFELPFGTNKPFLSEKSLLKTFFGDWQLSGSWNIASGTPTTARVLGSYTDVARGSNGSLRADATGLPVSISNPDVSAWFNTAAFAVPAPGQFGNVGRNTIRTPGTLVGNLSLNKTFPFADGRSIDIRGQATNFLNMPQFKGIDTTVNSPSFGRVTSVGPMRKIQIMARFNF